MPCMRPKTGHLCCAKRIVDIETLVLVLQIFFMVSLAGKTEYLQIMMKLLVELEC